MFPISKNEEFPAGQQFSTRKKRDILFVPNRSDTRIDNIRKGSCRAMALNGRIEGVNHWRMNGAAR